MRCALLEVEVLHGTQGLCVLFGAILPVEAAAHEVGATIFFEQPALRHVDPCGLGHQVVCVLDSAIESPCAQFSVRTHPVKLEQPVLAAHLAQIF